MPRLSIVIPFSGPQGPFEDTLAAVLQNRPSGCEVLVAHAQPYDDPYALGEEVTFVHAPQAGSNLVALANCGVEAAASAVIEIVPCGAIVTEGWTSAALLHFADPQIAAVAPAVLPSVDAKCITSCGVNLSSAGARQLAQRGRKYCVTELVKSSPLAATLCGGFFRKEVVSALGGFEARLGKHAADLDFALCAKQLGLRTEGEPASIVIAKDALADDGSFAAGRTIEQLYLRHRPAIEGSLAAHALHCAGEAAFSLVQPWWLAHALGRCVGALASVLGDATAARITAARERFAGDEPQILALPRQRVGQDPPAARRRAA